MKDIPTSDYIYGTLFIVSNKLDTLMERQFSKFGVTTKQWFLTICLMNLFKGKAPTLKEVAKQVGSSHQNIKQMALRLEEKELLVLKKDDKDQRVTRLHLTKNNDVFWKPLNEEGRVFKNKLFEGISPSDLEVTRHVLSQLWVNLDKIESESEGQ